jgi:hypothetical protein
MAVVVVSNTHNITDFLTFDDKIFRTIKIQLSSTDNSAVGGDEEKRRVKNYKTLNIGSFLRRLSRPMS